MRKLLATVGSVLLGLPGLVAGAELPVAAAHQDHLTFEWREPAVEGGDVEGTVAIRARAELDDGVDRWQVDVLGPEGEPGAAVGTVCAGDGDGEDSVDVECDWDSTGRPDGSILPNNAYRMAVTVWNKRPGEPHAAPERTVTVANPPGPVENVQLAYERKNAVVTVSWAQNPEPDIAGYLVEERFESGDWALVARPTSLFWSVRLEARGTYRYRVAAARKVGSTTKLKPGPFGQPHSGPTKIQHEPEPEPSTTTSGKPGESGEEPTSSSAGGHEEEPVGSVTFTYEGRPPAEAGLVERDRPPAPPPPPAVSPIQPGAPGSVETRYADPLARPRPLTPGEAFDPGFSMALPYPPQVRLEMTPPVGQARILGTVALFQTDEDQQRAVTGVLAGGLCLFVFSMQFLFVNRRPRATELLPASADWD